MKPAMQHALMIAAFAASAALADPGDVGRAAPADPYLEQFMSASERKEWARATEVMKEALAKDPRNADYHNLYAYAIRRGASPNLDLVFKHYSEALRIDPRHRGAHEYLGEAYLMVGNLAKAKEHLDALDRLCFFGCEEHRDLKKAIAEYETRSGAAKQ